MHQSCRPCVQSCGSFCVAPAEATQHHRPSQQQPAEEQQTSSRTQRAQSGGELAQQGRDPHNRPVALETPKDQYNRHLEAARSRSGSLGHRHSSPKHASPVNGETSACRTHEWQWSSPQLYKNLQLGLLSVVLLAAGRCTVARRSITALLAWVRNQQASGQELQVLMLMQLVSSNTPHHPS